MFEDEVYEVSNDEFRGFMMQLKEGCFEHILLDYEDYHEVKIVSTDGDRHFASIKKFPDDDDTHFYIYEMPKDEERTAAKAVRKIILETKEEVEEFFKILNKLQEKKND